MRQESSQRLVREAAAAWHDRFQRERISDETRREFAGWLAESADHRAVYESIDQTWDELRGAAQYSQILELRHETALRLSRQTSHAVRPLRWSIAATILLVLGIAAATLGGYPSADHSLVARLLNAIHIGNAGHFATSTGERLAVTLGDGSQVTLDTQTELNVNFTPAARIIHLTRGQAFFEVAKDRRRPFVVEVGSRRFVAVGTAFDVRLDGEQIKVTMLEGIVQVERREHAAIAAEDGAGRTHRTGAGDETSRFKQDRAAYSSQNGVVTTLNAGEQRIVDAQRQDRVRFTDPERSTSWRRGQVVFDDTRLADAVAELNRYSETKIELADPALAELRLSGAFAVSRPTVFIEAVTTYFPIRVAQANDRVVVLRTRE